MSFSRPAVSNRRQVFLALASSIESQLRDAYAKRHAAGLDNQTTLAEKVGVHRSAINKRLLGKTNMTEDRMNNPAGNPSETQPTTAAIS